MKKILILQHLTLLALAAVISLKAQTPGTLDTSFGGTGQVTTLINSFAECRAVLIQPDGKLVSVGTTQGPLGNRVRQFALLRQFPNGQVDTSFGTEGNGKVTTAFSSETGSFDCYGYAAALQPDGKIIVTGYASSLGGSIPVARYLADGKLDPGFGTGGTTLVNLGDSVPSAEGRSVAVLGDGKILLGGTRGGTAAVVRLLSSGALDESFGSTGVALGSGGIVNALSVQSDGKIVGAGSGFIGTTTRGLGVFRWLADGTPDSGFGTGGMAMLEPRRWDIAHGLALQPDGGIVVTGVIGETQYATRFIVARFTGSGQRDASFSGDGLVEIPLGGTGHQGRGIAVQADGKIVAGGYRNDEPLAARLLPDGSMDPSFGENGLALSGMTAPSTNGNSLALAGNGRILLGGSGRDENNADGFQMTCWRSDGKLDGAFGATGKVFTRAGESGGDATCMALQADGKILLAGRANLKMAVARYFADGRIDASFGDSGMAIIAAGTVYSRVYDMAVQPNGRILLAGYSMPSSSQQCITLLRCLPDGSPDNTFGQGGQFTLPESAGSSATGYRLALQPDGKILIGATRTTNQGTKSSFVVTRVLSSGALDAAFGEAGVAVISFGTFDDDLSSFILLPDGRMVAAGYSAGSGNVFNPARRCAMVRLLADGKPDPSFGTGGKILLDMPGGDRDGINSLSLMPDGRMVAGGFGSDYFVARFLSDGALDVSYAGTGYASTGISGLNDVLALSDGGLLACGSTASDFHLAAFLPDGSVNAAFGTNGASRVDFFAGNDQARAVALQSNGGILLAGLAYNARGKDGFGLARFHGFASALTPLHLWRQTHFGTSANEGPAADTEDPDGDGVPNLLEFASGTPPRAPQPRPLTLSAPRDGSVEVLWSRNATLGNVTLSLQWSDTLASESWRSDGLDTRTLSVEDGVERMQSRIPARPGGRLFFRLGASY